MQDIQLYRYLMKQARMLIPKAKNPFAIYSDIFMIAQNKLNEISLKMNKIERFKEIVAEGNALRKQEQRLWRFIRQSQSKNMAIQLALFCMEDKFNRLKSLLNSNEKPNYESVSDTLTDLANYAIMMRIELEGKEGTTQKATQFECKVDADLSSLVGKIMTCPHKSLSKDGAEEINKALRQLLEDAEEAQKYFSESVSDLDEMKKNILKGLADRFKELAGKIFDDDIFCTIKF